MPKRFVSETLALVAWIASGLTVLSASQVSLAFFPSPAWISTASVLLVGPVVGIIGWLMSSSVAWPFERIDLGLVGGVFGLIAGFCDSLGHSRYSYSGPIYFIDNHDRVISAVASAFACAISTWAMGALHRKFQGRPFLATLCCIGLSACVIGAAFVAARTGAGHAA